MQKTSTLIDYPIFRLTVSMAAGIFLFNRLMMEQGITLVMMEILAGTFVLLVAGMLVVYRSTSYESRMRFGILSTLCFATLGALRLAQEGNRVNYQWSLDEEVYYGKVLTPPVQKGKTCQVELFVESSFQSIKDSVLSYQSDTSKFIHHNEALPVNRHILLYMMPDSLQGELHCGDGVLFFARIALPASDEELTGFNYGEYLYNKGISGTAIAFRGCWRKLKCNSVITLKELALTVRQKVVDCYTHWNMGKEELAVVAALTVGYKEVLTADMKEMYSAAGVSHVLALSGLHIGILSAILLALLIPLKYLPHGETVRSFMVIVFLWSFAFISGLSPSVVRAVMMCTLYFGASCVLEERFFSIYSLILTAFIMLLYQPFYLFDLSFQLSFLAVASILYFYPLLSQLFKPKMKILRWIWNGIAVSLSAQLGTLPLILYYFGTFPVYFLLANQIVSVLAVCILGGALAALLVSSVPYLGTFAVSFLVHSTQALNASVFWIQHLEGSQITAISISTFQSVCGFLFLYALYEYWLHRRALHCILMLLCLGFTLGVWAYHSSFTLKPQLYFSRSSLYLKQGKKVELLHSTNGLYLMDTLNIGILKDSIWTHKQSDPKIRLDYAYLCRGFRGNMKTLSRVFNIQHLILDTSLSPQYRQMIEKQCKEQKISYTNLLPTDSIHYYRIKY